MKVELQTISAEAAPHVRLAAALLEGAKKDLESKDARRKFHALEWLFRGDGLSIAAGLGDRGAEIVCTYLFEGLTLADALTCHDILTRVIREKSDIVRDPVK